MDMRSCWHLDLANWEEDKGGLPPTENPSWAEVASHKPRYPKNTKFNKKNQAVLETHIEVFLVVSMRFSLFVRFINAYKGLNYKYVSY